MPLYTLTITSVDRHTSGGTIAVAIADTGAARFSLAHGIRFQPCRAAAIRVTEVCLTEDAFTLGRPLDDTTPWDIVVHIEAEQPVVQFHSVKSFSGPVVFLSEAAAASHTDADGDVSVVSLRLER